MPIPSMKGLAEAEPQAIERERLSDTVDGGRNDWGGSAGARGATLELWRVVPTSDA